MSVVGRSAIVDKLILSVRAEIPLVEPMVQLCEDLRHRVHELSLNDSCDALYAIYKAGCLSKSLSGGSAFEEHTLLRDICAHIRKSQDPRPNLNHLSMVGYVTNRYSGSVPKSVNDDILASVKSHIRDRSRSDFASSSYLRAMVCLSIGRYREDAAWKWLIENLLSSQPGLDVNGYVSAGIAYSTLYPRTCHYGLSSRTAFLVEQAYASKCSSSKAEESAVGRNAVGADDKMDKACSLEKAPRGVLDANTAVKYINMCSRSGFSHRKSLEIASSVISTDSALLERLNSTEGTAKRLQLLADCDSLGMRIPGLLSVKGMRPTVKEARLVDGVLLENSSLSEPTREVLDVLSLRRRSAKARRGLW